MDLWLTEKHSEHAGLTLKVTKTLFAGESEYQRLDIVETPEYGRVLLLDGLVMITERDGFIYHEMLVHPALFTHPHPRRVLIIGGGDGGAIGEILKHESVERAVLCEIDELVIAKAVEFLPDMARDIDGRNPRVEIRPADGVAYLREQRDAFDVILVDSTDPVGPAAGLFEEDFYRLAQGALKEDGILVAQSESPFYQGELQRTLYANLRAVFPIVEMYQAFIPTYPSGMWSFAFAGKSRHPLRDIDRMRIKNRSFATRYYNEDLHVGAFMLPTFVRENIAAR